MLCISYNLASHTSGFAIANPLSQAVWYKVVNEFNHCGICSDVARKLGIDA